MYQGGIRKDNAEGFVEMRESVEKLADEIREMRFNELLSQRLVNRIQQVIDNAAPEVALQRDGWKQRARQHGCKVDEGDHECG